MPGIEFDIDGAINAGYSPAEINDYLGQQSGFDVAGARDAGYNDEEILQHFFPVSVTDDKPPERDFLGTLSDVGLSAIKSTMQVPKAVIGLLDIPTGGAAGHAAESMGIRFKDAEAILDDAYSPVQKAANQRVEDAKGFLPTIGAMVQNPSTILHGAVESAASMGAGGVAARGAMAIAPKLVPWAAGAIGEGLVGAGTAAEDIRQRTEDGSLSMEQSAAALGSGVGTGIFGAIGGRIANKYGFGDVDTMLAQGSIKGGQKGVIRNIIEGGLSEGVLEEMPQSAQEQVWMNAALGKPLMEGVEKAAAQGMVIGAAMGGGANVASSFGAQSAPTALAPETDPNSPAGLLGYNAGEPLVVFPDGSTMTRAEADQRRMSDMVQSITSQPDVDSAVAVANASLDDEFASLRKQEEIDLSFLSQSAAAEATKSADFTRAQRQIGDITATQADALTRAQGFDERTPTAIELAMQRAEQAKAKSGSVKDRKSDKLDIPAAPVQTSISATPIETQPEPVAAEPIKPQEMPRGTTPAQAVASAAQREEASGAAVTDTPTIQETPAGQLGGTTAAVPSVQTVTAQDQAEASNVTKPLPVVAKADDYVTKIGQDTPLYVETPPTLPPRLEPAPDARPVAVDDGATTEKSSGVAAPVQDAGGTFETRPDGKIHVRGYTEEGMRAAAKSLGVNNAAISQTSAVFPAGTSLPALKEALNPGSAYLPSKDEVGRMANLFPEFIEDNKFNKRKAWNYVQKHGTQRFHNKADAQEYADKLAKGEGGDWAVKRVNAKNGVMGYWHAERKGRVFSPLEKAIFGAEEKMNAKDEAALDNQESQAYDKVLGKAYAALDDDAVEAAFEAMAEQYGAASTRDYQKAVREYLERIISEKLQSTTEGSTGVSGQVGGAQTGSGRDEEAGSRSEGAAEVTKSENQPAAHVAESLAPAQEAGDGAVARTQGGAVADQVAKAKEVLDAAGITGTDRTTTIAAVRRGDLTAEDVKESYPVQGKETPATLPSEAAKEGETATDKESLAVAPNERDSFTLERLNGDTMEPVTFERGEYVRYTLSGKDQFGDIDGISHARREFSVDGIWYPFGFAYKAERPEVAKPKNMAPLSSVVDAANRKYGEGLAEADRIHTLAVHSDLMDRVRAGDITADELKASFDALLKNKSGIIAELSAMTKPAIFKEFPQLEWRYKNDKKADVVNAAFTSMLDSFVLGSSIQWSHGDKYEDVIRGYVEKTTDEDLQAYSAKVAAAIAEREQRAEEAAVGMENPQTLDDFKRIIAAKAREIGEGATLKQALMAMPPEQRERYDELAAEKTRGDRNALDDVRRTTVRVADQTMEGQIIETKHTKTGEDLFVVKAADRVEREVYNQWNTTAKRLGGWYSSYRGGGAVPGFQFKTRDNADAFLKYLGGDVQQATEVVQERRDAFLDDRSQTAVERLNEMAARLEERADESLGQERKANTERRARMAASAESAANADKALAGTMRNIAKAIEDKTAKFLNRVRQKTQVELLQGMVRTAQDAKVRAQSPAYADQEKRKGEAPNGETADYAEFPSYTAYRSDLAGLGRALLETEGTKKLGQQLMKVADDVSDAYLKFAKENLTQVSAFRGRDGSRAAFASKPAAEAAISRSGYKGTAIVLPFKRGENLIVLSPSESIKRGIWEGDNDKRITLSGEFGAEIVEKLGKLNRRGRNGPAVPWQFESAYDKRKKLAAMGIETPAEMRAALREFIGLRQAPKARDRIKELERAMIGRRADGLDFFPTASATTDEMVETAGIEPGMSTLEPEAGMGHIADRIREAGVEPDVVELSGDRRELLEAKGYNVVGHDFLSMTMADTPDGNGYDRIIMNPPFSDRRDAAHVEHAYTLLKPGGRIVSLMGEGVFFGQDNKAKAFRDWLDSVGGTSEKLPEGSFMDPSLPVNTGTNARMVVITKETDKGVSLEARAARITGATPATIRASLVKSFGRTVVANLERKGMLTIAPTIDDLPRPFNIGLGDRSRAVFDGKDRAYLIANRIPLDEAKAVLLHEIGEHYGLKRMLGDRGYSAIKKRVELMERVGNKRVRDAYVLVKKLYPEYQEGSDEFFHEVLADIGQDAEIQKKTWWKNFIESIRRFLVSIGYTGAIRVGRFANEAELSVEDIHDMVIYSLKRAAGKRDVYTLTGRGISKVASGISMANDIVRGRGRVSEDGETIEAMESKVGAGGTALKAPQLPIGMQTQEQMLARGAGGHLTKAWERYIDISKIDGQEPTPDASDDIGYVKGRKIDLPIEVAYDSATDTYMLYAGNHRVTQAVVNGDKFIRAWVQPDKGRIGKDAKISIGDNLSAESRTPAFKAVDTESAEFLRALDPILAREPSDLKSTVDSLSRDAEFLSNLFESESFRLHGFGGLDIPSQREVIHRVLSLGEDYQVVNAVVQLIPVDVMNVLGGEELSADVLFHDEAMLKNLLSSIGGDNSISASQSAGSLVKAIATVGTEIVAGSNIKGLGRAREILSAVLASEFVNSQHGNSIGEINGVSNTGAFSATNPSILESRSKIIDDNNRTRTPEQLAMFKRVGRTIEVPTVADKIKAFRQDFWKKATQGLVDQFAPIKDLSKEAYGLMRLSKGATGAFEVFMQGGRLKLTDGAYDFDDTKKGGVIDRLLTPLQNESSDFLWWVAANRAEKLAAEDRENLWTPADISAGKSLADGTTEFDYTLQHGIRKGQVTRDRTLIYADSLKTFNEFHKNALDMAEQSGLIDPVSRAIWESDFYVPFYRVNDEEGFRGMNIKSGVVRQEAFKQLKGGSDKLNSDLLENTLMNWAHLLDAAAKNRAASASIKAAVDIGIAEEVPAGTKGAVWVQEGGKKKHYTVSDPYVLTALTSLEYAGLRGGVMDALSATKHWLTIGVTASPFFKIRNLIRDSIQVIGTSDISYNPAKNLTEGFKATKRGTDEYFRTLAGGGLIRFGTMLEGNEANRTRALVEKGVDPSTILDNESKVKAFYKRTLEPLIEAYNELGNRGEEINRAALYKQLRAQGVSHAEASLEARDLLDFSMQGSWASVRFLTQVVPFMNARLQGMYKLGRAGKNDPVRMASVIGAATMISLGLLAAFGDDEEWKKREDWDRNNYWWFRVGGIAYRIPKPFEIGAVATMAERTAELMFDNEMTGKRFAQQFRHIMSDQLSMNPVPQAFKPLMDIYANKDSFSGRPIETMGMERLAPEYRFRQGTSMVARGVSTAGNVIAKAAGTEFLSPVQIDHLVRGYFSWLGAFIVGGADLAIRSASNEPTRPALDYWKTATGGMVSETSGASSRYVTQLYEQAKELEEAYGTYRNLVKEGKTEEAKEFQAKNRDKLSRYRSVEAVKRKEAQINNQIRLIERSSADPATKRERINKLRARQSDIAKALSTRTVQ